MSDRLGRFADAVRIPAGTVQIVTSGTPGLTRTAAIPLHLPRRGQHQAWVNVRKALLAAGGCLSDVVSVRAWLTDAGDVAVYTRVYDQFIDHEPVTSLVRVVQAALARDARPDRRRGRPVTGRPVSRAGLR